MVAELLILTALAGNAPAAVYTDSIPSHWRTWTVIPTAPTSREDRCQARMDARRELLGSHPTRGLPRVCMDPFTRKLRPDPSP